MTDTDSILTENEQSELQLNEFIRYLVFYEGKFGREAAYFMSTNRPQQWAIVHQLINEFERQSSVEIEVADLGEHLDLPAYIQIVQDYIQMFSPANEKRRNHTAIISLLAFSRLYARRLKQRAQQETESDQYTQKDLERLVTYTKCVIQKLLQNGLKTTWGNFCKELKDYQIDKQYYATLPDPRALLITASICGCLFGIYWFIYRSNISAKH